MACWGQHLMGSKLGTILSLIFAVFVFIFAADLISLQANYTQMESIANTIGLMLAEKGGAWASEVRLYMMRYPEVTLTYDSPIFKVGEFKEFIVTKTHEGIILFNEPHTISVKRTALIGQFEGIYK